MIVALENDFKSGIAEFWNSRVFSILFAFDADTLMLEFKQYVAINSKE